MFEKVFALLFRLYPSRFRKEYEQEASQLLHDRLRDESGFSRRTRLVWDLLADALFGLPQAYRNSYAAPETAALSVEADGVPSFSVLTSEPIGRGSILLGGALSLSTIIAFGWLLSLSLAHLPVPGWNGRLSPIEAVVARLNQGTPIDGPASEPEQASRSTAVATSDQRYQTRLPAGVGSYKSQAPYVVRKSVNVAKEQDRVVAIATQTPTVGAVPLPPRMAVGEAIAWKGNLTDASGQPVRSAEIHVIGGNGELVARTTADGSFAFPELPSGDYEIAIVRDGHEVAYRKTLHLSATSSPPQLTLASGGRVLLSAQ